MKQAERITLDAAQMAAYEQDGFLVVENLLSREEIAGVAFHQDTHYLPTEPNTLMAYSA